MHGGWHMTAEERLSRELDEAIEQQHIARVAFTKACEKVRETRQAYEQETSSLIEIHL